MNVHIGLLYSLSINTSSDLHNRKSDDFILAFCYILTSELGCVKLCLNSEG